MNVSADKENLQDTLMVQTTYSTSNYIAKTRMKTFAGYVKRWRFWASQKMIFDES